MTDTPSKRSEALAERLFGATIGALELLSIYLGGELGLYRALEENEHLSAQELAARAGIDERYAREWLEQQAVAGLIEVEDTEASPDARRYRLPAQHARVLRHPDDPAHVAPFAHMIAGIRRRDRPRGRRLPHRRRAPVRGLRPRFSARAGPHQPPRLHPRAADRLAGRAARRGRAAGGRRPPPDRGRRLRAGLVDHRRRSRLPQRLCRRARPRSDVDRRQPPPAADAGLDGRVRFSEGDAAELAGEGPYDLVLILEALHDLARPVEALRASRAALADGGTVLVVDERMADSFTAPGDEVERMMFGWSVTHCLPTQLAERPSAALGTGLRAHTIRELADEAGYTRVDVLAVENDFLRLYRLDP